MEDSDKLKVADQISRSQIDSLYMRVGEVGAVSGYNNQHLNFGAELEKVITSASMQISEYHS